MSEKLELKISALEKQLQQFGEAIHQILTANQAAWIEWKHGKGAEAAMEWVENGLIGPGLIPDEAEPWAKEAQAWYNAHAEHAHLHLQDRK